jgi:hypothetical protein
MIQRLLKSNRKLFLFSLVAIFLLFIGNSGSGSGSGSDSGQTTVISHYFKINRGKHSDIEFQNWIRNFLMSVKSPLILFTDNKSISKDLLDLRKNLTTKLYIYSSHWEILKEIEQKRKKNYTLNYKHIQNTLDPEKEIHNPDLYLLWNIKSYITNKIAQENPFDSKIFIYTDSGAWRHDSLIDWPNELFIKKVSNIIQDKILLAQISDADKSIHIPLVDCIEGGFFMGSKIGISNFEKYFWEIHDQRLDQGLFIGKDQIMMNMFAFKSNKSYLVKKLKASGTNCLKQIDIWFFYQYYLASDNYFTCNPREKFIID